MRSTAKKNAISKMPLIVASVLCGIVAIVAIIMLVATYNRKSQEYSEGVGLMVVAVRSTIKDLIESKGGIERSKLTVDRADYSQSFLCIDVNCPDVHTNWILLADKDQGDQMEKQIKESILSKRGGPKWSVDVLAGILGKDERPYDPPTGKEWYNISIYVTYGINQP